MFRKSKGKGSKKTRSKSLEKAFEEIDNMALARAKIKSIKLESLIDQRPERILDFVIDQFSGVESFEVARVNYF